MSTCSHYPDDAPGNQPQASIERIRWGEPARTCYCGRSGHPAASDTQDGVIHGHGRLGQTCGGAAVMPARGARPMIRGPTVWQGGATGCRPLPRDFPEDGAGNRPAAAGNDRQGRGRTLHGRGEHCFQALIQVPEEWRHPSVTDLGSLEERPPLLGREEPMGLAHNSASRRAWDLVAKHAQGVSARLDSYPAPPRSCQRPPGAWRARRTFERIAPSNRGIKT